jgi:two-component system cell cycle sensor histidine kinase/response regulator CckA
VTALTSDAAREDAWLEPPARPADDMAAIRLLTSGIAHDFCNVLTVITGNCQLAMARLDAGAPMRDEIEEIRRAAEHAAGLTRQLLAFSRQQTVQSKLLNLNDVLGSLSPMLGCLTRTNIEFVAHYAPDLPPVIADRSQLEQIVLNLVINARDAMPDGGTLSIETATVTADEAGARHRPGLGSAHYVMLAVADSGHGMDAAVLAHAFEPFFTTKDVGQGTGLGLATVQTVVSQGGGHIEVGSVVGQGTTVRVYLPEAVA